MTAIGHTHLNRLTLDRAIDVAVAGGVAVLVVIGFATSYETLRGLAVSDGGFTPWLAPAVPLSFDLGIVVLSLKVVGAARRGRRVLLLRALVAALSASSVAVNSTASSGAAGRLLHAVPPAMFVICFESLAADARCSSQVPSARRDCQWGPRLLDPVGTFRRWRDDVLMASTSAAPEPTKAVRPRVRDGDRTAPSRTRPPIPESASSGEPDDRLALVREVLRCEPHLSAPALAHKLRERGHEVSVRTAQRLKARTVA